LDYEKTCSQCPTSIPKHSIANCTMKERHQTQADFQ
jgi:hypothetical protein